MNLDISLEEDTLQSQAFAVEDGSKEDKNIDKPHVDEVPTTGNDYLRLVRLEAKDCPRVVVAELNMSTFLNNQTVNIQSSGSVHPASRGFGPSLEWQRLQVANFSTIRQGLVRHSALMKKNNQKVNSNVIRNLPISTDVQGWCSLCFGRLKAPSTSQVSADPQPPNEISESNDSNEPLEMEIVCEEMADPVSQQVGIGPLLSVITAMDQLTVLKVLEYHLNWFQATGFTEHQGQWFYALLACLEKPLEPDACSLIRTLARSAASLRAALESPTDAKLAPLNLIICLVSLYFDQKDLMDKTS